MTGAELIARVLESAGITHSAGVLGGAVLDVVQEITGKTGGRFLPVRHEQVAASLADGFARVSRRPAVAFGVVTAGATNLLTGVAIAWRDSSPLVVITANEWRSRAHRDVWQGMDVVPLFAPITKYSRQVRTVHELPYELGNALLATVTGRPGPVHLDLLRDIGSDPVPAEVEAEAGRLMRQLERRPIAVPYDRPHPEAAAVDQAVALLRAAQRPVLAVGAGVLWSGATAELRELAELLQAPVVVSGTARGALPEDHPLATGPSGNLGSPVGDQALRAADVVVALGARLQDHHTRGWTQPTPAARIIQNDIDPAQVGRNMPVEVRLAGDARDTIVALLAGLKALNHRAPETARSLASRVPSLREQEWDAFISGDPGASPVEPSVLAGQLRRLLPRSTILTHGAGVHTMFANRIPVYQPHSHLKAIESGAMSFAFPAGLGAALAAPDRPVVALVGDGDFMMTVQDLETAVRERLPLISVVFNNFSLRAEKLVAGRFDESIRGVDHGNPDFGQLAKLFGADGATVTRLEELEPALLRMLAGNRPGVIDVHVDPAQLPRWMREPFPYQLQS